MDVVLIAVSVCALLAVIGSYLETKARIARIEHKVNLLLKHSGIDVVKGSVSELVKEIARDPSRKIEAIKVYREETGASLADAKKAVEDYMHSL